ncbi:MAG: ECF-type sigma factor [Planctomycetota bacterium]
MTTSVTLLLERIERGEEDAGEELYSLVYPDLHARAARMLKGAGGGTLQATALVHEAWLKLAGPGSDGLSGREHFFGVAAKAMRSVVVDHARARNAAKRPAEARRVVLDEMLAVYSTRVPDLLALNEALEELGALDAQLARIVELRFFAGLSIPEAASVLGIGRATVERGWASARAFLGARLGVAGDEAPG